MKNEPGTRTWNTRVSIAAALAGAALLLGVLDRILPPPREVVNVQEDQRAITGVDRSLDSLLSIYGISPKMVTSWHVSSVDKKFTRVEHRVFVPPDFIGYRFNHDLARIVARFGARVSGTDHAKEGILKLHIVRGGLTIRSISFEPKPRDQG